MSPTGTSADLAYALARRVLLDALIALSQYGESAAIVVGAQAIYLRCSDEKDGHHKRSDFIPISPFTTDADIVLDLNHRENPEPIRAHLERLGYRLRGEQPGLYYAPGLPPEALEFGGVDLFVPEAYAYGISRRDANIPNDARAARRQRGLELSLYDRSRMEIRALDLADGRVVWADVAGPAALLAAKLVKLSERRSGDPARIEVKDALDVSRLLRATDTVALAASLVAHRSESGIESILGEAFSSLERDFVAEDGFAIRLIDRHLESYPVRAQICESTRILAADLLAAIRS